MQLERRRTRRRSPPLNPELDNACIRDDAAALPQVGRDVRVIVLRQGSASTGLSLSGCRFYPAATVARCGASGTRSS